MTQDEVYAFLKIIGAFAVVLVVFILWITRDNNRDGGS
jgi:hypothetical protein